MSKQSMAAGDPYCPTHGFTPCSCWENNVLHQASYYLCNGCGKGLGYCMCSISNNPYYNILNLESKLPKDIQICVDPTKPVAEEKFKTLSDEFHEIAFAVNQEIEANSAYVFFLERSKLAAKKGQFKITFWKSGLPWVQEELNKAADLLRKDNFDVSVEPSTDMRGNDIEIIISW
jgi:hypothetical protein